jgi:hypothetical protein
MQGLTNDPNNWKEFFDNFSKRNKSRLVSVEIFNEFGAQKEVKKMPLSGIVFESRSRTDSSSLEIMLENRRSNQLSHLTHFIPNVKNVLPKKYADGCDEALEVEDAEGNKTLLTFEKLPELRAGAVATAAAAGIFYQGLW